jgi:acetyl/propionyl-CoA carboxylase alpha subunit
LSAPILAAAGVATQPTRHAIEVRLSAEDPGRDFSPVPGRIGRWLMPAGPGVRVDTAIEAGDRVPPDYDPLVAKILVVDADRDSAIGRLARVLDEVEITGIQTTLPFHRFLARHPGFREGRVSTRWVDEAWSPAVRGLRAEALRIAARAAVAEVAAGRSPAPEAAATRAAMRERSPAAPPVGRAGHPGWVEASRAEALDRWPR